MEWGKCPQRAGRVGSQVTRQTHILDCMNKEEAIKLLKSGPEAVKEWNLWRKHRRGGIPISLAEVNMQGKSFCAVNLDNVDLQRSNLSGADLTRATACGADFASADLRNTNFSQATLHAADFDGADLRGARFDGASLVV